MKAGALTLMSFQIGRSLEGQDPGRFRQILRFPGATDSPLPAAALMGRQGRQPQGVLHDRRAGRAAGAEHYRGAGAAKPMPLTVSAIRSIISSSTRIFKRARHLRATFSAGR